MRNDGLRVCLDVSLCLQWHVAEVGLSSDSASWPTWESLAAAAQLLWLQLCSAEGFELNEGGMAFAVGAARNAVCDARCERLPVCTTLPKVPGLLRICALQGCCEGWLCSSLALRPRAS